MNKKLYVLFFISLAFMLDSCGIFAPAVTVQKSVYQNSILGKWRLQSMQQGEKTIDSTQFKGEASMEFFKDGNLIAKLPGQQETKSRFALDNDKVLDLGSKEGSFMRIKTCNASTLVLEMTVKGKPVLMSFDKM